MSRFTTLTTLSLLGLTSAVAEAGITTTRVPGVGGPALTSDGDLVCAAAEIYFDGDCRSEADLDSMIAPSGSAYTVVGYLGPNDSAEDYLVVIEQTAPNEEIYTILDPSLSGGATRDGYAIHAQGVSLIEYDSSTEELTRTTSVDEVIRLGSAWTWSNVTFLEDVYGVGYETHCVDGVCTTAYSSSAVEIGQCDNMLKAATADEMITCAAVMSALPGATAGVVVLGLTKNPMPALAAVGVFGGPGLWVCDQRRQKAMGSADLIQEVCGTEFDIDVGPSDPPTGPGGDESVTGCLVCTEWETQSTGYETWEECDDGGTVTWYETGDVEVCTKWSVDPEGSDLDGDGFCDE